MLVAVALIVRRYYVSGVTTQVNRIKLIVCLVLILGSSFGLGLLFIGPKVMVGLGTQ